MVIRSVNSILSGNPLYSPFLRVHLLSWQFLPIHGESGVCIFPSELFSLLLLQDRARSVSRGRVLYPNLPESDEDNTSPSDICQRIHQFLLLDTYGCKGEASSHCAESA